jgi:hypothetical protein
MLYPILLTENMISEFFLEMFHATEGMYPCFASTCIYTSKKVEELSQHLETCHSGARYRYPMYNTCVVDSNPKEAGSESEKKFGYGFGYGFGSRHYNLIVEHDKYYS